MTERRVFEKEANRIKRERIYELEPRPRASMGFGKSYFQLPTGQTASYREQG
jgi:hypothetical protein